MPQSERPYVQACSISDTQIHSPTCTISSKQEYPGIGKEIDVHATNHADKYV